MRLAQLFGQRLKEAPRDAQTVSHTLLIRGGYCRPLSTGIYTLLPLGRRVAAKVETIIREEMNRIDGQEVLMPIVQPAELWQESGRYQAVGPELLRFTDRNDKSMVLAMTHEEAVCHAARTELNSYKQLPCMVYQLQTKYRDEARPRAGLIRVREFTMKDGYSFHTCQTCLEAYYQRVYEAYERIFRRVGLRECISIESDSGMIGGAVSHEFMAVAECGEDTFFVSPDGRYKANRECAVARLTYTKAEPLASERVHTPGTKTIDEVAALLGVQPAQTGKAVFYRDTEGRLVFVCIRGDIEVNEAKLRKVLTSPQLAFASDAEIEAVGAVPGYASLLDVDPARVRVVVDPSFAESSNLVVGANAVDYHVRNFNYERDLSPAQREQITVADVATVREGDPCPLTGQPLHLLRGIEVGNIFQLGTKYSAAMNVTFLDPDGKAKPMVMGCYGIGVGRTVAAVVEQNHDAYGPVWPLSIAPFQVHLCALNIRDEAVRTVAEALYRDLQSAGLDVLLDDRSEKAGFMFNDADLIGVPLRLVVSPKTLAERKVEFKRRDSPEKSLIDLDQAVRFLRDQVAEGPR
jgi:prolyl-tRNA synthetase